MLLADRRGDLVAAQNCLKLTFSMALALFAVACLLIALAKQGPFFMAGVALAASACTLLVLVLVGLLPWLWFWRDFRRRVAMELQKAAHPVVQV